ncbi:MAG TPA: beta-propeller fold lactonase family protein [Stellaceae bacterium]|nr:beta-propeller fold lactonase family protein [Stellaceae bacterium]
MRGSLKRALIATFPALLLLPGAGRAQLLISGNDEKIAFEPSGARVAQPPGKDTVSIIDIAIRAKPRIVANLPLMNSIAGPPTNLAITPDQHLALVANALDWVEDGESWKGVADDKLFVIDLTASPPALIATLHLGKQPSGMAINRAGTMALVANADDDTVSVLAINGKEVTVTDTVAVGPAGAAGQRPVAVAIAPDGKRALVAKAAANTVALLAVDGDKVRYANYDMATGLWPDNVQITPDGKLAIVNNNGGGGQSDGQIDTAAIIDMEADPPRVIDQVVVGDGPKGLAMSPAGGYAASLVLNGSAGVPKGAFFSHEHSFVALLRVDGKKVRKIAETDVGKLAEGIAFSPDGRYLYVGNFVDGDISILRLQGGRLMQVGSLKLAGHPASLRGSTP